MKSVEKVISCLNLKAVAFVLAICMVLFILPLVSNAADTDDTAITVPVGDGSSLQIVIVGSEDDLPDGYDVDEEFIMRFELDAEGNWYRNLTEMLRELSGDEYVYFFLEEDVPEGYTAQYILENSELTSGNIVIIKNVKKGEPPVSMLPSTGESGTMSYMIIAAVFFLAVVVGYYLMQRRERKESEELCANGGLSDATCDEV